MPRTSIILPRFMIVIAVLSGSVSLLLFGLFLVKGSLHLVALEVSLPSALALDTVLSIAFFMQHSIMLRRWFRIRLERLMPARYQPAFYTLASSVALLAVVVFWQDTGIVVVSLTGWLRHLARAAFLLSAAGMAWGALALHFDLFGLKPLMSPPEVSAVKPPTLSLAGPYRVVRHPLYLFSILMIWMCPTVTIDRLLFDILWTAWIVVGTMLEERDLVDEFGQPYREYQKNVPMLIPWRLGWVSYGK